MTPRERRERIEGALDQAGGNVSAAARDLGMSRRYLSRLVNPTPAPGPPMATVQLELPVELKQWLELEALRLKHTEGGRASMSRVVVGLIEAQRAAEGEPGA